MASPLEFKIKLWEFEHSLDAHHEFVMTKGLLHHWFALLQKTPAVLLKQWQKIKPVWFVKMLENVGWRLVCEVGEVGRGARGQGCKTSTWHHTHLERASLSAFLLSSPLRTCFPGPHFLTGCLVWVTGCWLPVYWEGTDSKVKARHPVECREEEVAEEAW